MDFSPELERTERFALRQGVRGLIAIDRRALVAFRVGLGALVLADLFKRALTFEAHYTDAGVLPIEVLRPHLPHGLFFQLLLDGSTVFQAALFVLTAAAALCVLLGWYTRVASVVLTTLVASLQMRNPLVCHTGE